VAGHFGIDDDTLWSIIQEDLPSLIAALESLKSDLE
jgi:uncharacterized protein with HEPN domain